MSESIIIALLGVASSMILVNWRLKKLEEKVDSHNGYAKMFYETHESISLMQKDIQYLRERAKEN